MTNIEFVKLTVYGDMSKECSLSDTDINEIIISQGVNSCIEMLCSACLVRLSQEPTSVNDGAVSLSFADRKDFLLNIMKKAQNKEYKAPEGEQKKENGMGVVYV